MAKMKKQKNLDGIINTLKEVSLFKQFADKPEELGIIAKIMKYNKARKGAAIIKEGEFGDSLYILLSGTVSVLKRTLEKENYTVVQLASKKESVIFFGEMALLDNDKRSATIIADTDCELLEISRKDFIKLGDQYPHLGLPITREISAKLSISLRIASQDVLLLFEALVGEVREAISFSPDVS